MVKSPIDPPPAYNALPRLPIALENQRCSLQAEEYNTLKKYDIVYIVDDNLLMSWVDRKLGIVPWAQTRDALALLASICAEWDDHGQEIWFVNKREPLLGLSPEEIQLQFDGRSPVGTANMASTLLRLVQQYLGDFIHGRTKALNIVAISNRAFPEEVANTVAWTVQQLEVFKAPKEHLGIQFVQVGADNTTRKSLRRLASIIDKKKLARDIVDIVPWESSHCNGFTGEYLGRVVSKAVHRRLSPGEAPKRPNRCWRRLICA